LFDQFRVLPQPLSFDLNTASRTELFTLRGMRDELAARLESAAPFATVDDVRRVPGAGVAGDWLFGGNPLQAILFPLLFFGLPGALFRLWRERSPAAAGLVLFAWMAAAAPAAVSSWPWA
jgi:hypothetical protein